MPKAQLEKAWLYCIWENPVRARQHMLGGLDQSAFKDKFIFESGLKMLRDESFQGNVIEDDQLLMALMERKLVSEFAKWQNDGYFLPAFYKIYCQELEARMEQVPTPKWNAQR